MFFKIGSKRFILIIDLALFPIKLVLLMPATDCTWLRVQIESSEVLL